MKLLTINSVGSKSKAKCEYETTNSTFFEADFFYDVISILQTMVTESGSVTLNPVTRELDIVYFLKMLLGSNCFLKTPEALTSFAGPIGAIRDGFSKAPEKWNLRYGYPLTDRYKRNEMIGSICDKLKGGVDKGIMSSQESTFFEDYISLFIPKTIKTVKYAVRKGDETFQHPSLSKMMIDPPAVPKRFYLGDNLKSFDMMRNFLPLMDVISKVDLEGINVSIEAYFASRVIKSMTDATNGFEIIIIPELSHALNEREDEIPTVLEIRDRKAAHMKSHVVVLTTEELSLLEPSISKLPLKNLYKISVVMHSTDLEKKSLRVLPHVLQLTDRCAQCDPTNFRGITLRSCKTAGERMGLTMAGSEEIHEISSAISGLFTNEVESFELLKKSHQELRTRKVARSQLNEVVSCSSAVNLLVEMLEENPLIVDRLPNLEIKGYYGILSVVRGMDKKAMMVPGGMKKQDSKRFYKAVTIQGIGPLDKGGVALAEYDSPDQPLVAPEVRAGETAQKIIVPSNTGSTAEFKEKVVAAAEGKAIQPVSNEPHLNRR